MSECRRPGSRGESQFKNGARLVMDTIMMEHKMGGMLDYDLIEEDP